jgi:nicotinamide-nucleotide amidase
MSPLDDMALQALAVRAGTVLLERRRRVVVAESCTGGWVAKCLTDIPGSSQWFERGYVTYSNAAKEQSLHHSDAALAVAVTGIAGPDGGTPEKPVGLVWFARAQRDAAPLALEEHFGGDREAIRRAAVATALRLIIASP